MAIAFRMIFLVIMAVAMVTAPIEAMNPRKLDDTTPANTNPVGSPDDDQMKCGSCPCGKTCYSSPPPPPPSPSPPPPAPKKPSPTPGLNCPPPPSGGGGGGGGGKAPPDYIYITGPPGDLYPVVQSVSDGRRSFTVAPSLLVLSGLLGMLGFW
ncbi:hypothetical protein Ccrd_001658 [Cynara cardunculus var. scolymus]|uniref:Uncharacterized protein n=1 Tax=Cynara cardunculus var. scolymus TaxID=59895 RepID=A0A103XSU7_CYNCS|nr:hypothetical protein Ccrd_001658 [Cynara cardunculus var. scolymus]